MSVNARATVTLEIKCNSHWSDDTQVSQVKKQAEQDAVNEIRKIISAANQRIKLIGDIKIKIVTFDV